METTDTTHEQDRQAVEQIAASREKIEQELSRVIIGQKAAVEEILITLFAGGNCLITGVPGLAKTLMVRAIAGIFDLEFHRIQFTPDLMPADITGTEILTDGEHGRELRFVKGPVFTNVLLADEINRTPPKTQAALLEAMQEKQVTVGGTSRELPKPFFVLATQNPIEQEGTYPLPEAQLDRFLLQIDVDYPSLEAERQILMETTGTRDQHASPVFTGEKLMKLQQLVRRMPVPESVVNAILELVRSARPGTGHAATDAHVAWGPGPRASQSLMLCSRARALYEGRFAPSIDDVKALAEPVLQHRMALTFAARAEGVSIRDVIADLVKSLDQA